MDSSTWACSTFEAQKWRQTKCKHCFQDIERHSRETCGQSNVYTKSDKEGRRDSSGRLCLTNEQSQTDFEEGLSREVTEITKSIDELEKLKHTEHTSLPDAIEEIHVETDACPVKSHAEDVRKRSNTHDGALGHERSKGASASEVFASFKDDLQVLSTPLTGEDSPLLPRKPAAELSRFSTVEFSSTSSLASFDPLEENTLSSYSYSGSRDNLDGFASGDELSFAEGLNETRPSVTDGKVVQEYEEKIENLEDKLKSVERDKEREIQALDREIQGLKLELAKYSARENITIVKNRLEVEGKNQAIEELKEEIKHLQSSINDLSQNKHSEESRQDFLQGEVKRRNRRVLCLEEEKKSLEERLSLAEDLQKNDRDLLDVLRHQLTTLEGDLLSSEDRNKQLERQMNDLKAIECELKEERVSLQKIRRHAEFLSGKLKLREQHVSFLEDDNVKMQQEKTELEAKVGKDRSKIDRLNTMVRELKSDAQKSNQEIKLLCEENSQLEQAHWQVVVNQGDASGQLEDYIKDLEKRVSQGEARIRDLEYENESLISQSSEMLENLVAVQSEDDENKRQLELMTESYNRLQATKTDQDKRMIPLQRKLKKLQKERKRLQIEKQEAEEKISLLKLNDDKVSTKCDDIEKGYKMLQLKLQSTEAKLTMVERNKIYMESKVSEYEKKYKSNKETLAHLNCVINDYLHKIEGKGSHGQKNWDLDSVEVKLCKIIDHGDKLLSELGFSQKKNHDLIKVINNSHVEMADLRNDLQYAKNETVILKRQLEDRLRCYDELQNCFTTSVAYITQQNDMLEGKLEEVNALKSMMDHYEDRLKRENCGKYEVVDNRDGHFDDISEDKATARRSGRKSDEVKELKSVMVNYKDRVRHEGTVKYEVVDNADRLFDGISGEKVISRNMDQNVEHYVDFDWEEVKGTPTELTGNACSKEMRENMNDLEDNGTSGDMQALAEMMQAEKDTAFVAQGEGRKSREETSSEDEVLRSETCNTRTSEKWKVECAAGEVAMRKVPYDRGNTELQTNKNLERKEDLGKAYIADVSSYIDSSDDTLQLLVEGLIANPVTISDTNSLSNCSLPTQQRELSEDCASDKVTSLQGIEFPSEYAAKIDEAEGLLISRATENRKISTANETIESRRPVDCQLNENLEEGRPDKSDRGVLLIPKSSEDANCTRKDLIHKYTTSAESFCSSNWESEHYLPTVEDSFAENSTDNYDGDADIMIDSEMDSERPCTSVKCVFQVEASDKGTLLDYSAKDLHAHPCKYRADVNWMELGHDIMKPEMDTNTPYYTVAISNIGCSREHSPEADDLDLRLKKDCETTRASCRDTFEHSKLQISQEGSGAITLTIPKSRINDAEEEELTIEANGDAEETTSEAHVHEDSLQVRADAAERKTTLERALVDSSRM